MDGMAEDEDFYEPDEPIEDILAALEAGPEVVTEDPRIVVESLQVRANHYVMQLTTQPVVRVGIPRVETFGSATEQTLTPA